MRQIFADFYNIKFAFLFKLQLVHWVILPYEFMAKGIMLLAWFILFKR